MDKTNIKLICISATGMNNVDLEYASDKNIEVKNVVDYSTSSVVQLTISLALHLIQNITYYDNYVKNEQWCKSSIFTHIDKKFYELDGKTWGIIGLGNIGKGLAKVADAFGCNIQYYSTSGANNNSDYKSIDLNTLLNTSDIISIHSPLNEQTLNLIGKHNIELIQNNSILINVGRGGIVNEECIASELDKRNIFYASDVLTTEPMSTDSPFISVKNKNRLLLTPHIAWASVESRNKLINKIKENIRQFTL